MLQYVNILYEKKDGIGWIVINRPDKRNALNQKTLEEISKALDDVESDPSVGAVVVTGSGQKAFVAGADISEISQLSAQDGKDFALFGQALFSRIENLGKPVIAAVNGFALGGGCELAMACTLRIASENAKFGQPEVDLGLIPGYGGTQRLPRLVGKGRGLEAILTGDMVDAHEAYRIGLVNRVTVQEELIPFCEALAKKIMGKGPVAIRHALIAVNHGIEMPLEEGMYLEATLFGLTCTSEDMKEGTRAFMEKRKAQFKGK